MKPRATPLQLRSVSARSRTTAVGENGGRAEPRPFKVQTLVLRQKRLGRRSGGEVAR
jgi:hypothetical protein